MKRILVSGAGGVIGSGVAYELYRLMNSGNVADEVNVELAAFNEPAGRTATIRRYNADNIAHGRLNWIACEDGDGIALAHGSLEGLKHAKRIPFFDKTDPTQLPLRDLGIDMVLECSGFYGDPKSKDILPYVNGGRVFLDQGVQTVIQTYPAKTADATLVMGVNHTLYDPRIHRIISNASCTTKAMAAPLIALLDAGITIDALSMDTTHAATGKDLTKLLELFAKAERGQPITRAELEGILEVKTHSTGAAQALSLVIPQLKGRMAGMAYRVPALDGSFANIYFRTDSDVSKEGINEIITNATSNPKYQGRLGIITQDDAGTKDIVGRRENGVVITSKTDVRADPDRQNKKLVTLISGYDNELGPTIDPVMLANYIAAH